MTDLRGGGQRYVFPVETLLCSLEVIRGILGVRVIRGQQDILGVLFNNKK
jgi:hypothetical protein